MRNKMTMGRRRREPEEWLVFHCPDDCCLSVAVTTPCTPVRVVLIIMIFAMMLVHLLADDDTDAENS